MARAIPAKKKHRITWDEFKAFAAHSGRDLTHAFRVFRGERESRTLEQSFEQHFGFPMRQSELAGRQKSNSAA